MRPRSHSTYRFVRSLGPAIASAALAACAGFGDRQPAVPIRDAAGLQAGKALAGVPLSPAAWPVQAWWQFLGDQQLDALIDEALAGSPSLETATARSQVALAEVQASDAARGPSLSAAADYNGIRIPGTFSAGNIKAGYTAIAALSLRLSWSPDLWGGQRARYEAAVGRARAAEVDAQAARVALSVEVASAYSLFAYGFSVRDIAEAELRRATELLALTRQRVAAGIDSEYQLKAVEAAVPVARQRVQAAQLSIDGERAALAALLGQGPDRGLAIERPPAANPIALALPSQLPAELLGRRPDLVAARWRAEAALRDVAATKTTFYPNINLSAAAGLASGGISDLFEAGSRYYEIAPAISLPLFDSGRLRAGLARADAEAALAVGDYDQKLVDALRDVATAIATLHSLADQHEQQTAALTVAQQACDYAQQRYGKGVGNRLELLNAQAPLLNAEAALADLHIQQLHASLQVIQALGGGWQDTGAQAAPLSVSGVSSP